MCSFHFFIMFVPIDLRFRLCFVFVYINYKIDVDILKFRRYVVIFIVGLIFLFLAWISWISCLSLGNSLSVSQKNIFMQLMCLQDVDILECTMSILVIYCWLWKNIVMWICCEIYGDVHITFWVWYVAKYIIWFEKYICDVNVLRNILSCLYCIVGLVCWEIYYFYMGYWKIYTFYDRNRRHYNSTTESGW